MPAPDVLADRLTLPLIALLSLTGGAAGAALLLLTPDSAFRVMVPWLILVGTALFALGPWLLRRKGAARPTPQGRKGSPPPVSSRCPPVGSPA